MKQVQFLSKTVNIIGFPIHLGQPRNGTELGPQAIRASGLRAKLEKKGLSVRDSDDLQFPPGSVNHVISHSAKNASHVSQFCHSLAKSVSESVKQFEKTVVLGGDHSLGMGSIFGHAKSYREQSPNRVAVLWIDAHADINTESTSSSGNMHGMPVSFILKGLPPSVSPMSSVPWISPVVESRNFAFIGLRDVEKVEEDLIQKVTPGIRVFTSTDVRKQGARDVILRALDHINPGNDLPIHVSFDIDVIDPKIVKSTGTTCPSGLVPDDAYIFGEQVSRTGCLRVMDMAEVNPLIGSHKDAKTTAFVASEILASFMQPACDA